MELFWKGHSCDLRFRDGDLRGRAIYSTESRKLEIHWRLESHSARPASVHHQTIGLADWPTALCSTAEDTLCVAGKRKNGNTVIEIWRFPEPVLLEAPPRQPGEPPRPDVYIVPPSVETRTVLYDEATEGRDMVSALGAFPGTERNALVLKFWDSGDLYVLDEDPGATPALLATPSSSPPVGVYSEPKLDFSYDRFLVGDHVDHGFVYIFIDETGTSPGGAPLLLRDTDRDGRIDDSLSLVDDLWFTMGFADASLYRE